MVRFKLSVKGSDVPSDLKGMEIGKAIQKKETEKYLGEQGLGSNKKIVGDDEYTFGADWIPTSLGQRKKMKLRTTYPAAQHDKNKNDMTRKPRRTQKCNDFLAQLRMTSYPLTIRSSRESRLNVEQMKNQA